MAESLKAQLARIAEDIETEPNGGARLQRQIDLLTHEIEFLLRKVGKLERQVSNGAPRKKPSR